YYASQCEPFLQRPVGFDHRAASGIQAQRYLRQHGVRFENVASLVVRRWRDAEAGGRVAIEQCPDIDTVLAAPNAARPLTSLMLRRPTDGAIAVLLGSAEIARRAARTPVWVTGTGSATDCHAFAARRADNLEPCAIATRRALDRAGWPSPRCSVVELSG